MLESAEVGHTIDRQAYDAAEPPLREALLAAQFELRRSACGPVILLLSGIPGVGRGDVANRLTAWMDPRFIAVAPFAAKSCEARLRPPAWRYWQALPPRGGIALFIDGWYADVLPDDGDRSDRGIEALALHRIREHEQLLVDEGVTLVKVWLHMRKADLKRRVEALERDPRARWRVTRAERDAHRTYAKRHPTFEHLLRETSTGAAPWTVVESADERYRDITVGTLVHDAMRAARRRPAPEHATAPVAPAVVDNVKRLRDLDLSQKLAERAYERELEQAQSALAKLVRGKWFGKRGLVLVFEGVDAAGKGGAVRRVTAAFDAGQYTTIPVSAPSDEERAYPWLWRFWRHVPRTGEIAIFDRSWYGRVLVERVERFCSESDWLRAYDEINRFEEALVGAGIVVVKFWMHVSRGEQLARFRARQRTPFKRFKISEEDWRNRRKWPAYERAIADMIDRTSTEIAPWTLVEAEDKRFARVKVVRTIVEQLDAARRER